MGNWKRVTFWIGVGLLLGVSAGLYLGWAVWPPEFTNTDPAILRDDYKQEYALMIAQAYALDGDLDGARRRLYSLGEPEPDRWLLSLTVDTILSGRDEMREIRPLVRLAYDLGLSSPAMVPYLDEEGQGEAADDVS
jgi:hypothetical protein